MRNHLRRSIGVLGTAAVLIATSAGCGDDSPAQPSGAPTSAGPSPTTAVIDPGDGGNYNPEIDPADFVTAIDNPYMPLRPGSRWHYEGTSDGAQQTTDIVVTRKRNLVMGVSTIVVRDTVREEGSVIEDTYDWFAQDTTGNVWYFGEAVKDYENGKVVSTAGSWEAGVDGALPGIVMPAEPRVGDAYRQEYYAGEAEDMMKIVAVDGTARVPAGAYDGDVVVTHDWNPLEPDVIEEKSYARGVGRVVEKKIAGGNDQSRLVRFTGA
jgi:hypothetical protein